MIKNLPISNEGSLIRCRIRDSYSQLSHHAVPGRYDEDVSPRDDDRLPRIRMSSKWGLSLQQALPADFVGTVSFPCLGARGRSMSRRSTLSRSERVNPVTGRVPTRLWGSEWRGNKDNSNKWAFGGGETFFLARIPALGQLHVVA